jgi:hypothetical protein
VSGIGPSFEDEMPSVEQAAAAAGAGNDVMNYSRITSQIWLGSAIKDSADVTELMNRVKPTRIIDCRAEFDDRGLLGQAGLLNNNPNFYLFDGIPDWRPEAAIGLEPIPDLFFKQGLDFWMPYQQGQGEVLYIHCSQGINRSVTLTYAILIVQGMSRVEAMVALNAHRAVTGLNDFLDHPWRENAEHALHRLGYVVR